MCQHNNSKYKQSLEVWAVTTAAMELNTCNACWWPHMRPTLAPPLYTGQHPCRPPMPATPAGTCQPLPTHIMPSWSQHSKLLKPANLWTALTSWARKTWCFLAGFRALCFGQSFIKLQIFDVLFVKGHRMLKYLFCYLDCRCYLVSTTFLKRAMRFYFSFFFL